MMSSAMLSEYLYCRDALSPKCGPRSPTSKRLEIEGIDAHIAGYTLEHEIRKPGGELDLRYRV
jgi:hypothetical protein